MSAQPKETSYEDPDSHISARYAGDLKRTMLRKGNMPSDGGEFEGTRRPLRLMRRLFQEP